MYIISKTPSAIATLKYTLENILPDLLTRPTDDGILGFYEFRDSLDKHNTVRAVNSVIVYTQLVSILLTLTYE